MRVLDSICTSGSEGVIIASIEWWSKIFGLEDRMAEYALTADVKQFKFRADFEVGIRLSELLPELRADFLRRVSEDPGITFVLALALGEQDFNGLLDVQGGNRPTRLRMIFFTELGSVFKKTDFFEKVKKITPRSTVVKMAAARLSALRILLPLRNESVRSNDGQNHWLPELRQTEETWPDPATVEGLRAMLGRMHPYSCAPEERVKGDAWRKACKELTAFLKRPDVDDQVIQEGMDMADVTEIMGR